MAKSITRAENCGRTMPGLACSLSLKSIRNMLWEFSATANQNRNGENRRRTRSTRIPRRTSDIGRVTNIPLVQCGASRISDIGGVAVAVSPQGEMQSDVGGDAQSAACGIDIDVEEGKTR